jgi:sialidase-1
VAVRGNVIETSESRLLVSAYDFPNNNTAQLFQSTDTGKTWSYLAPIAKGFNETYLLESAPGHLLAFLRGWEKDHTYLSQSTDGRTTWSTPKQLCKGYPACAVLLPNDQIFIAYGYRFPNEQGVRAQLLSSEGNPINNSEIIIRNDGATFDLGYPKACLLPTGQIYLTYYINRKTDASDATAPRYIEGCIFDIDGK